ncbi:MAG: glycosyltransferase family 2 protein [Jhaorihella sp.]
MKAMASVILPAHDEAGHIGACLSALLASHPLPQGWRGEVIVVANGCRDGTAGLARGYCDEARARGWALRVIELAEGNKLRALNAGDAAARGGVRIYLDADVIVDPALVGQLIGTLGSERALYSSGTPRVARAESPFTRAYGRFWLRLPFMTHGVPGFGVFAVNGAGRARWEDWPDIISDDTFVRLQFAPPERVGIAAGYVWPMVEGFANLVRVRRRQNEGVAQIAVRYPALLANDDKARPRIGALAMRDPVGFAAYALVALAVKTPLFRGRGGWARGR